MIIISLCIMCLYFSMGNDRQNNEDNTIRSNRDLFCSSRKSWAEQMVKRICPWQAFFDGLNISQNIRWANCLLASCQSRQAATWIPNLCLCSACVSRIYFVFPGSSCKMMNEHQDWVDVFTARSYFNRTTLKKKKSRTSLSSWYK